MVNHCNVRKLPAAMSSIEVQYHLKGAVTGSWVLRLTQETQARMRLICFPRAGAPAVASRLRWLEKVG
jgi:hypothetical protein